MKNKEKKQILGLMDIMMEANSQLAVLLKENRINDLMTVLADEQEAAMSIGNRIEELMGEGSEAVSLLEEYCELLWKTTQDGTVKEIKKDIEELNVLLNRSIKVIKNLEGSAQIDVVFLPYNSSMWDCMETVWRAANNDPICNVYVIPIPYFELNSDGSLGKMHYEGENFPSEVQITPYQEYDIKQHHPDIIYIHNPYDEYNKVTRVHSNYYSSVLKDCTDMLVYIPYFITNGQMPETHKYLPAYIYANKIILQTEEMVNDIDQSIPKDKLLPLGNPKTERIIWMETNKKQINFPEEWEKKSAGKKVVFFNVSISSILKYGEKMLDKIEEVFRIANSNDNILLLWRPHPLLEATLDSMCGDLVGRYHKLMRWYKKKNIGILDQTADPGMAVVFSDAYIGEATSSILELFRTVNKTRLLISEKQFYQPSVDEMQSEITCDICRVNDNLWFVTSELQMLCKYNINDGKLEEVAEVPETKNRSYVYITYYDGNIILIPGHEAALCIYDIKRKCFTKKYFKDEYVNSCFCRGVVQQEYLYLSPVNYPELVRYNMHTGQFEYFEQCVNDILNESIFVSDEYPFLWGMSSYEAKIYMASKYSNCILVFDTKMLTYQIVKIGDASNVYRDTVSEETYSWLIDNSKPKVVRWNRKTDEVTEYIEFPQGFISGEIPFANIINFEESLYLIPYHANNICRLDKRTGVISYPKFKLPYNEGEPATEYYKRENQSYLFAKKISEVEMIAMSLYDNQLVLINIQTEEIKYIPLRIQNHIYWELRKKEYNLIESWETHYMPLSKYFECVSLELEESIHRKGAPKPVLNTESHIGEKIHQTIKQLL